MKFTKEAWEAAPEGSVLEMDIGVKNFPEWIPAHFVGYSRNNHPVVEMFNGTVQFPRTDMLRIVLPKRKVTVRLWRDATGTEFATVGTVSVGETLLGEHTFEIEGE